MISNLLTRYIMKTVIFATALTTLILGGVLFLMTLLKELKNIGEGDYGLLQAIFYIIMRMPMELYQFSPLLILLGSIAGLSVLSAYRELAVMRTSGFSIRKIILSVLSAALLVTLCMSSIGEGFAPKISYLAEVNRETDRNAGQAVITSAGIWLHVGDNFIHVEHVIDHQLLEGVTRYQFDAHHHLKQTYYAKTLSYQGHQWTMNDGVKTTLYADHTQSENFQHEAWPLKFNTHLFDIGMVDPSQMSLPKLAKFSKYLEQNGLQAGEYRYEFWQRVFQPFASLVMIFLAIPFVLGTLHTASLGLRMVIGTLTGFAFFILNALLGQVCVVYQVPAVFAAALPIFSFIFIGCLLLKRLVRQ